MLAGLLFMTQSAVARVAGMSAEQTASGPSGSAITKVVVRCSASREPRTIVRQGDDAQWCDSTVTSLCSAQKLDAAKAVCGSSYKRLAKAQADGQPQNVKAKNVVAKKEAPKKPATVASAKPNAVAKKPNAVAKKPNAVAKKPNAVAKTKSKASSKKLTKSELAAAQSELFDIEQKRVQIQQRQLELRKLELELQKQRVSFVESGF